MNKLKLVKQALAGLEVEYVEHYGDEFTQAKVNGHSIVWHKYAYADPDKPEVEVYLSGTDEPRGYVPISELRSWVE